VDYKGAHDKYPDDQVLSKNYASIVPRCRKLASRITRSSAAYKKTLMVLPSGILCRLAREALNPQPYQLS
jgi:hypothetical protein